MLIFGRITAVVLLQLLMCTSCDAFLQAIPMQTPSTSLMADVHRLKIKSSNNQYDEHTTSGDECVTEVGNANTSTTSNAFNAGKFRQRITEGATLAAASAATSLALAGAFAVSVGTEQPSLLPAGTDFEVIGEQTASTAFVTVPSRNIFFSRPIGVEAAYALDTVANGGNYQSTVVAVAPGFKDGISLDGQSTSTAPTSLSVKLDDPNTIRKKSAYVESSKPPKSLSVKLDDQSTSGKKSPQSHSPAPAQKVLVEDKKPARRRKPKRDPSDIRVVMEKGQYRRKARSPSPEMKVKLEKSTPKRVDSPAATTTDIPAKETSAPTPPQNDKKEIPKFESIRPEALAYIKGYNAQNAPAEKSPPKASAKSTASKIKKESADKETTTTTSSVDAIKVQIDTAEKSLAKTKAIMKFEPQERADEKPSKTIDDPRATISSSFAAISEVLNDATVFSVGVGIGTVALITQQKRGEGVDYSNPATESTIDIIEDTIDIIEEVVESTRTSQQNPIDFEVGEPGGAIQTTPVAFDGLSCKAFKLDRLNMGKQAVRTSQQSYLDSLSNVSDEGLSGSAPGTSYLSSLSDRNTDNTTP